MTQTYEGGLGGEPGNEAHGGYTYCGLAALMLAESAHVLHLPRLLHWAVHCQARLAVPAWGHNSSASMYSKSCASHI